MSKQPKHSKEHKAANKKVVKIGGKKKLLLFDSEEMENENQIFEKELQEIINQVVAEAMKEVETDEKEENEQPLYEGWLDETDYPEGFDVEEFKNLSSFNKRIEYAKEKLGKLGAGSSRIVFAVDPKTVIKIAKNKKGIAQNEVEVDISNMGYENIAKVFDYDPQNYLFIEMERARKLKPSDWKKITGYSFDGWMAVLYNYLVDAKRIPDNTKWYKPEPENPETIEESGLFNELLELIADFDMPPGDFMRLSSWGVVSRDGQEVPVLIDYGLTNNVYNDFYAR